MINIIHQLYLSIYAILSTEATPDQKARLCWANYHLDMTSVAETLLTGDYNNDQCWRECGKVPNCIGYQIDYASNDCWLISGANGGTMGNLVYAGTGMPEIYTSRNIYAMEKTVCPDKEIVRPN